MTDKIHLVDEDGFSVRLKDTQRVSFWNVFVQESNEIKALIQCIHIEFTNYKYHSSFYRLLCMLLYVCLMVFLCRDNMFLLVLVVTGRTPLVRQRVWRSQCRAMTCQR